jgi:hypothetical protein
MGPPWRSIAAAIENGILAQARLVFKPAARSGKTQKNIFPIEI